MSNLHKGLQKSLSNDNLVLPEIEQSDYVPGLSKGMLISPDTAGRTMQKDSKKFMATSDFRMYDPVKKA